MPKEYPSDEILCNICNVLGRLNHDMHYTVDIGNYLLWKQLLKSILKLMDLGYDFITYDLHYIENYEDDVLVEHEFAKEHFPHRYKKTPWKMENIDLEPIEEMLNSEEYYEIATYLYPFFEAIGYILTKNEERWRLRWHDRPDLYPSIIRDLEFFGKE